MSESDSQEATAEVIESVEDILDAVLDAFDLDVDYELKQREEGIFVEIGGEDLGRLIGKRGRTLDAVQLLCYRAAARRGFRKILELDAGGYREQRAEELCKQAEAAAEEALENEREVSLDAMPPSERRIVHRFLRDWEGIETFSEGEEPHRYLVIAPAA